MKILTVVGARPQFVKAAAVSGPLRAAHQEVLVHTGQHYDDELSAQFFRELELPKPDYELGIGSAAHGAQTGRMLERIEHVLLDERPDTVMVYGDTNSTLAGALAASKLHVPVAHVEAGLRSFNRGMPEEINRVLTDHVSTLLFCPSEAAAGNLTREGITGGVHVVGDVMADVFERVDVAANGAGERLSVHGVRAGEYLLATVHRAENVDQPERLRGILSAFESLGQPVLFPMHPRVRAALERMDYSPPPQVMLRPPVGYLDMILLERHARVVLTDSGGVQKEAFWAGVPCVTLRDETEWTETVEQGWNTLAGADRERIIAAVRGATVPHARAAIAPRGASAAIVRLLSEFNGTR